MWKQRCTFSASKSAARRASRAVRGVKRGAAPLRSWIACSLFLALCATPSKGYAKEREAPPGCDRSEPLDPVLAGPLRTWLLRPDTPVKVYGLSFITEAQLWALAGITVNAGVAPPSNFIDRDTAAAALMSWKRSGLFAELALVDQPAEVQLRLVEYPVVSSAEVIGLRESDPTELLAHYLGSAPAPDSDGRETTNRLRFQVWRKRVLDLAGQRECVIAAPPAGLFARVDGARVEPGILRGGMEAARRRAVRWLRGRGYPLAVVKATITSGNSWVIEVDEGRLAALEVRGVSERLRVEIEATLELRSGQLFSSGALRRAATRLFERYPFLELDTGHAAAGEAPTAPASAAARSPWEQLRSARSDLGDLYVSLDVQSAGEEPLERGEEASWAGNAVEIGGPGRVILWLRTKVASIDVDWIQLLRHTPATGFAPGLAATLHLWDADDRAHLAIDGALAVNTKRAARAPAAGADLFERWSAAEQVDWLAGARLAVPPWKLAEVGVQLYALTDTNDSWRMSDINSYLHSALLAVPDREYFRRAGATVLSTFQLFDQLTLGAEMHQDRFDSLPNPRVWSLFNGSAQLLPAAPVTAAQIGSILLRAEWSSEPVPLLRVGKLYRHAELPLSEHASDPAPTFVTLATVQSGDRALGSDPGINYLHVLSDSRLQLALGSGSSLRLRLRVGAGAGLPLQLDEALGGWSALRGYSFKEFRGDISVLGNAEARWHFLGAFLDLGAVHQPPGWTGARPGVGAQLFLEHIGSLEVAWRLDGNGTLVPSARALLGWEL